MMALVTKGIERPGTHHTCQGWWRGLGRPCFLDKGCSPRCQFTKFQLARKLCQQEEAGDKCQKRGFRPQIDLNLTVVHGRGRELEKNMTWRWALTELSLNDLFRSGPSPHQVCFPLCQAYGTISFMESLLHATYHPGVNSVHQLLVLLSACCR